MESRFRIVEELDDLQVTQLFGLIRQQWWGKDRSLEDVRLMVCNTSLITALVDRDSDALVAFARVLTDFAFRATIYDVMVRQDFQGQGLGRNLMDTLCHHPRLRNVSLIYLACEPNLFPFYEKWGFRQYAGRAEWMIKVQREE